MKKLVALVLTLSLVLSISAAFAVTDVQFLHRYSFDDVVEYDYAKIHAKNVDGSGYSTLKYLVTLLGDEIAESAELSLDVYEDGSVRLSYLNPEGGRTHHIFPTYFKRIVSEVDNSIHVLLANELIVKVLEDFQ